MDDEENKKAKGDEERVKSDESGEEIEDEKKSDVDSIEDPFEEDSDEGEGARGKREDHDDEEDETEEEELKAESGKGEDDKDESKEEEPDEEKVGTVDEDEAEKIEEEREDRKEKNDFDDLTEDEDKEDKTEGFYKQSLKDDSYKPEDRTENYYQQMKNEEEEKQEEHIPPLGSMNSSNYQSSNIYASQKPQRGSKFHVVILIVIGLIVIAATVYFLQNSFNVGLPALTFISDKTPSPTPSPAPAKPTPTPTKEPLDRSEFKLEILNGTSTTGLAASTSSNLQDLGYEVVRVGNATNSSFEQTLVRVKPTMLDLAEQLIRDLAPKFTAIADPTLPDTENNDSVIILGTK